MVLLVTRRFFRARTIAARRCGTNKSGASRRMDRLVRPAASKLERHAHLCIHENRVEANGRKPFEQLGENFRSVPGAEA